MVAICRLTCLLILLIFASPLGCALPTLVSGSKVESKTDQTFTVAPQKADTTCTIIEVTPPTRQER